MAIVAVKETALLSSVQRVVGRIKIQYNQGSTPGYRPYALFDQEFLNAMLYQIRIAPP